MEACTAYLCAHAVNCGWFFTWTLRWPHRILATNRFRWVHDRDWSLPFITILKQLNGESITSKSPFP